MNVKVLNKEDNLKMNNKNKDDKETKILTSNYINQLNKSISYQNSKLQGYPLQDSDTVVVGGPQKSKSISLKCR